jgi:hypothetical protein
VAVSDKEARSSDSKPMEGSVRYRYMYSITVVTDHLIHDLFHTCMRCHGMGMILVIIPMLSRSCELDEPTRNGRLQFLRTKALVAIRHTRSGFCW